MRMTKTMMIMIVWIYNAQTYLAHGCSRRRVSQCTCISWLKSSHILCKWNTVTGCQLSKQCGMMASWYGSVLRITGPLCEWNPLMKVCNAELWCFLCQPKQTAPQTVERPLIWDSMTLIGHYSNDNSLSYKRPSYKGNISIGYENVHKRCLLR